MHNMPARGETPPFCTLPATSNLTYAAGSMVCCRQQRRLSNSPARARGGGTAARRARAAAHAPAVITTWDQLPIAVLAQVAQRVCKHGSLPMAPRLACVCTSWSAAVDATPELWRMIDTAAIPAKSWVQEEPAGGGVRSPPSKKQQGAGKGKQPAGRRKGANKQLSAEQGLRLWAGSGRLQELQALLLYGEGGAGCADPTEEQARDANRQLSAALLQELADSCQQLRRVSLFGAWSLRPEVSNFTGAAGWDGRCCFTPRAKPTTACRNKTCSLACP